MARKSHRAGLILSLYTRQILGMYSPFLGAAALKRVAIPIGRNQGSVQCW